MQMANMFFGGYVAFGGSIAIMNNIYFTKPKNDTSTKEENENEKQIDLNTMQRVSIYFGRKYACYRPFCCWCCFKRKNLD